jgi:hypothetical protein
VVPTVEMLWDCAVPGCDGEGQADGVKVVGVAVAAKRPRNFLAA